MADTGVHYIPKCEIDQLKPYDRNPRQNDQAVEAVRKSLEAHGFLNPIIVDADFRICCGHTRFKAATEMGMDTVPVIVAPHLVGSKFVSYNIADNQTGAIAEWDTPELAKIISELQAEDWDMESLGFDGNEIETILAEMDAGAGTGGDPEDVPEPPVDPTTQPGDLWLLGDHRLLCGDSTKEVDVCLLMDGTEPFMMVTDPPYGVEYDPGWRDEAAKAGHLSPANRRVGQVTNDDKVDWSAAWSLFPGDVVYCWHADQHASEVFNSLAECTFLIRAQIVWAKPGFVISRGHYNGQHEPCWYAVRKGRKSRWCGDNSQSTLWQISNHLTDQEGKTGHGTQKPLECMARPIRNHGKRGDSVYDPFLGSGTTLIACEQLGRKCYGMEIDPGYCDVVVERWESLTGKTAELVRTGNG